MEQTSVYNPSQEDQDRYLQGRPGATAQHLGIALQHAHQIQAQKDAEEKILDLTIDLLAIPSSSSADPAAPFSADVQVFKSALSSFRPKDLDNLIEERNYENRCGYCLCPKTNRKTGVGKGSTFHFKYGPKGSGANGKGRSVDIVPRESLEKWCSDACGERALYIRVQLSEEPIWERRADGSRLTNILLLEEARAKGQIQKVTAEMENLDLQDSESKELALERGDTSAVLRGGRVGVQIVENQDRHRAAVAPQMRPEDVTGGSIEGYVPRDKRDKHSSDEDDYDVLDQL
ncbi:hypothetical protein N7495_000200 [Penicillium taxi]|uniref:uncharacterized protein n=1 Tax=Penicillium taxi TaxID=168475 RepID=UPI002544F502|nr:uncharacterized protein N7495_000200 [Penicillium taxi]KAJ5907518.1 hypothetical protein N7495_000200 [Penicillium taxi]